MPTLSDAIERHLVERLEGAPAGAIEIQRAELAEMFGCVPSQVTYVLMTRFTPERGYLVEARRGGGGGIRITRLNLNLAHVWAQVAGLGELDQARAEDIVDRLRRERLLSSRETAIILASVNRQVLGLPLPDRDQLRARLLRAFLVVVMKPEEAVEP